MIGALLVVAAAALAWAALRGAKWCARRDGPDPALVIRPARDLFGPYDAAQAERASERHRGHRRGD